MEQGLQRFKEKKVLVTGAGSGIGRGIALRFAREGAAVAVCDINKENADETARMIEASGAAARSYACDVGRVSDIDTMLDAILSAFGPIDILVNNAGTGDSNMSFEDITSEVWDRIYGINVKGPFFLAKRIAKNMIDKKIKGRIINIASTEGKTDRGGTIAYASSKSALIGLTQGLAMQLACYDITVNTVCPGLIDTPIWHKGDTAMELEKGSTLKMVVDSSIESLQLKIPRAGTPDDIAGAVAFLASADAEYMTGQAINVCGGLEVH